MERYNERDLATAGLSATPLADAVPAQQVVVVAASEPAAVAGGWRGVCGGGLDNPIYHRHGFQLTLRVEGDAAVLEAFLRRNTSASDWLTTTKAGYTLVGTVWVTQRRSRKEGKPLLPFNRRHRVTLYGLRYDRRPHGLVLTVSGVRLADIDTLSELLRQAGATTVSIDVWTRFETYIALDRPCVERLLVGLSAMRHVPNKRYKKRHVIKNFQLPSIQLSKRGGGKPPHASPVLNVYRIQEGATYRYKVEVAFIGRKDGRVFSTADVVMLYDILDDLVKRFEVVPVSKPSRWEPREQRGGELFDRELRRITGKAYRGVAPTKEASKDWHTLPPPIKLIIALKPVGNLPLDNSIRTTCLLELAEASPASDATPRRPPAPHRRADIPLHAKNWLEALSMDLHDTNGLMAELVIPESMDELVAVQTLVDHFPQSTVSMLFGDGDLPSPDLLQLVVDYPVRAGSDLLLIWVDEMIRDGLLASLARYSLSTLQTLASAQGAGPDWVDEHGELHSVQDVQPVAMGGAAFDCERPWAWVLGVALHKSMAALRDACERSGLKVLFVSHDMSSKSKVGGELGRFTDVLVRSALGDAGRYHCHQRYRLDQLAPQQGMSLSDGSSRMSKPSYQLLTLKDELEGRTGRIVYHPEAASLAAFSIMNDGAALPELATEGTGLVEFGGDDPSSGLVTRRKARSHTSPPLKKKGKRPSQSSMATEFREIDVELAKG